MKKETLERLVREGKSHNDIALVAKVSRRTVGNWCKKYGIKTDRQLKLESNEKIREIVVGRYLDGESSTDLAKEFSINRSTVLDWTRALGEEVKTPSESKMKYQIDMDYFKTIDSHSKAYILGFILADGYIWHGNIFGINLSAKDRDVLEFIKKEMKSTHPIREYSSDGHDYCEFRFRNQRVYNSLVELGVEINKTLTLDISKFVDKLDKEYRNSLLLGYFDGDGGIYHYNPDKGTEQFSMSITGTIETCTFYKDYFQTGFITKRYKESDSNNYTYQIGGRNKVIESLSMLYESKTEFLLKRKQDIFYKASRLV